jgi:hypothetical protein
MTTSTELASTGVHSSGGVSLDSRSVPPGPLAWARATVAATGTARQAPRSGPAKKSMWRYRWDLTLTWRSLTDSPNRAWESRIITRSPEELCQLVMRTSYDPRIVSSRYERHAELDMSEAPDACTSCAEPYDDLAPRRHWRDCSCGGHLVFECIVCGHSQLYPTLDLGCI